MKSDSKGGFTLITRQESSFLAEGHAGDVLSWKAGKNCQLIVVRKNIGLLQLFPQIEATVTTALAKL